MTKISCPYCNSPNCNLGFSDFNKPKKDKIKPNLQLKVRVKLTTGVVNNFNVKIPDTLKDYSDDTLNDIVSDWLDDHNIKYKWYRVQSK